VLGKTYYVLLITIGVAAPCSVLTVPHPLPLPHARRAKGTPGDIDFGDREDGLLGGDHSHAEDTFNIRSSHSEHPEDDILGDLVTQASGTTPPYMRHELRITADMCAYTLVTLTFADSEPIHVDTGPCMPTAHRGPSRCTRRGLQLPAL
jgi:hypothetical protein